MIRAMTPSRATLPALFAAALLVLAACSGGGDEPEGLDAPTTTPSPTATPTPEDPDAEAKAEIEAQYQRYWDVIVASENNLDEMYEDLKTVGNEPIAQLQVADVRELIQQGITRDGTPEIQPLSAVTVNGTTARVEGCVSEDGWHAYRDGELIEAPQLGFTPRVFDLELIEGGWVVSERIDQDEATITC